LKISILKHTSSNGSKKDLPVNSEMGHVLVGDTEGIDDGSLLGVLLGVELGGAEGTEDGDCVEQVWKVTVSPYDPKIGLLGSFSVIRVSI